LIKTIDLNLDVREKKTSRYKRKVGMDKYADAKNISSIPNTKSLESVDMFMEKRDKIIVQRV